MTLPADEPPDLVDMRRQITDLRNRHSDHLRVTYLLNRLLVRIAYLSELESPKQAQEVREAFDATMSEVEKCLSKKKGKAD